MKKPNSKKLLIICLLIILVSLLLSGCTDELEPEKMGERTAVILNKMWDYASRFFTTLKDNLNCLNGVAIFSGFSGFVFKKFSR
jgi:hypothetical protein